MPASLTRSLRLWFDSHAAPPAAAAAPEARRVDLLRLAPFIALHLACLGAFFTGWSPFALAVAALLYAIRMVAITGFYHRYFSHKAFRASRSVQFAFAVLGASAAQRGPLWWAAHHRHHHAHADGPEDAHSPHRHGFLWAHLGWFASREHFATRLERVPDLARFPELRFLDRFDILVPALLGIALYGAGEACAAWWPGLGTDGLQLFTWGFAISTVALWHATFTVNSLAHSFGSRRYATRDRSRNNLWLALLTFGEGWHNNHHHFPGSARQGFYWWEVDLTWYALRALAALGLAWDLKPVPAAVRDARRETP